MPVDQAEHGTRRQTPADQEIVRDQQHAFDVRQRCRRHREHDHVVGQHRGEDPRSDDRDRQQRRGRQGGGRDPHRAPVVEPAGGELGGQEHQPEQDDQRREVDRGQHRCTIQRAAAVEQDRPQERDAGTVDLESRLAADRHAEIDRREDDEDEAGQVDAIMDCVSV
jgi:hypothetical protein